MQGEAGSMLLVCFRTDSANYSSGVIFGSLGKLILVKFCGVWVTD
jgi:hypothetical protein